MNSPCPIGDPGSALAHLLDASRIDASFEGRTRDAYLRGDHSRADRLARAGLELAADTDGTWYCQSSLALAGLSRDAYADADEHTQQWVTLRNLAQLLRRLGDHEPAALLDTAAEQAPDAPAAGAPRSGRNTEFAAAVSTTPPDRESDARPRSCAASD